MPLVEPLPPDHSTEIAELARFFEGTLGFAPNSVLTMMRRPALARAFTELNRAVMSNEGRVTSEFKRLIGHVASRVAGCRYCEAHTIRAAARFGEAEGRDAKRLDEVWSFRSSALFTPAERAALEFAMAAAATPGAVDAAIGAGLRAHWNDGEIVEITGVVALFGFLNRWNDAMATELEAPAAADGQHWLSTQGWSAGKHQKIMALKSTIYKAQLQIADMDRGVYADHALTLALHPSETEERMMVRLLAFALFAPKNDERGTLQFARGLSDTDEPDLWQHDLSGQLVHWIEVGHPDERRMQRAASRAEQATFIAYSASTPVWWAGVKNKLTRTTRLTVWQLPNDQSQALAALAKRAMQLQISVQDGSVWFNAADANVEVSLQPLLSA